MRLTSSLSSSSAAAWTALRALEPTNRCCGSRARSRPTRSWPSGADSPPIGSRAGDGRPGVLLRPPQLDPTLRLSGGGVAEWTNPVVLQAADYTLPLIPERETAALAPFVGSPCL